MVLPLLVAHDVEVDVDPSDASNAADRAVTSAVILSRIGQPATVR